VALKFYDPQRAGDAYRLAAFQREGQLLSTDLAGEPLFVSAVDAPGVFPLPIPVVGSPPFSLDLHYIPLEWQSNGDTSKFTVATIGYLDLLRRLQVFWGMCRCVSRVHRLGCIHRDLKPPIFSSTITAMSVLATSAQLDS
jgi:serine/threonine protein kinase